MYLRKCFFTLTAKLNVLEVLGVIFVPNKNTNTLRIVCKITPASSVSNTSSCVLYWGEHSSLCVTQNV
jgi:hypothetical protein